jgi:outer membrane protein OmpA-like peptidoglycan-associated protein
MATEHVKIYEEKKALPIWAWLLPLLLLLALLAWYLLSHHNTRPAATTAAVAAPTSGTPSLGDVKFATDSADLTPEDQATLNSAATYMKENPGAHLRVEGYTDSTGGDQHNQTLSVRRAYSVANYLKGQGIDGSRLTGDGFGPAKPVDTNSTEGGKADNRRVELFKQ